MKQDALAIGLAKVRARFVKELHGRFDRIDQLRPQLEGETGNRHAMDEIGQIAHKIAGTAATLGFPALGECAAMIDDLIMENRSAVDKRDQSLLWHIDRLHTIMQSILSQHDVSLSSH